MLPAAADVALGEAGRDRGAVSDRYWMPGGPSTPFLAKRNLETIPLSSGDVADGSALRSTLAKSAVSPLSLRSALSLLIVPFSAADCQCESYRRAA